MYLCMHMHKYVHACVYVCICIYVYISGLRRDTHTCMHDLRGEKRLKFFRQTFSGLTRDKEPMDYDMPDLLRR